MSPPDLETLYLRFVDGGDARAFTELFDRASPDLRGLALNLAGDRHVADDLLQETFLTAIQRRDSGPAPGAYLGGAGRRPAHGSSVDSLLSRGQNRIARVLSKSISAIPTPQHSSLHVAFPVAADRLPRAGPRCRTDRRFGVYRFVGPALGLGRERPDPAQVPTLEAHEGDPSFYQSARRNGRTGHGTGVRGSEGMSAGAWIPNLRVSPCAARFCRLAVHFCPLVHFAGATARRAAGHCDPPRTPPDRGN